MSWRPLVIRLTSMINWSISCKTWRPTRRPSWRISEVVPKVEEQTEKTGKRLVGLPLLVVGPVDVGRLIRELESIDGQLLQAKLRNTEARLPRLSHLMEQTVELNKLNMLHETDRK